jgi:HAD superfamily hydrolase (TIGR01509 family)
MPDLIIFDCDGVLIDSEILASQISARELTRLGYPITPEEITERFLGMSAQKIHQLMRDQYGYNLPDNHQEHTEALLLQEFRTTLQPVDGILDALSHLNIPMCVASSSIPDKIRLGLTVTGLLRYFDPNLFSASMVARGKPAPDLFLFAARYMRIQPQRCLVIEDSVLGVQAAVAAGMRVFGFTGGKHCKPGHETSLTTNGADLVFSDMRKLPALIKQVP